MAIAALYGLFNSSFNFSEKPKYEILYGAMVILLGPINYYYFEFGKIGLFHSIIGFLIMIIGWSKWYKSRNKGQQESNISNQVKKHIFIPDKSKTSHTEASGERSVAISGNLNNSKIITGDQKNAK